MLHVICKSCSCWTLSFMFKYVRLFIRPKRVFKDTKKGISFAPPPLPKHLAYKNFFKNHYSVLLDIDEESVYYEIDKLFNQLMSVNLEITEATER